MDRNSAGREYDTTKKNVALRKESVDRNAMSRLIRLLRVVALRKESVDRNIGYFCRVGAYSSGRSPQGERG